METYCDMYYRSLPSMILWVYRLWYEGFDLKLTFIVISPSIEPFNFYNYIECIPTKKCVNYQRMLSCCGHMLYIFLLFVGY